MSRRGLIAGRVPRGRAPRAAALGVLGIAFAACLAACSPSGMGGSNGADTGSPERRGPVGGIRGAVTGMDYLAGSETGAFERALTPRPFVFPRDHASHPGFRNEWWYFTGNVFDSRGRHFGFELTFFRIALEGHAPQRDSAWASDQVWVGHFALTDTAKGEFHTAERWSRGALGLAGAEASPLHIWVESWSAAEDRGGVLRLRAQDGDTGIDLELRGLDRIVAQGEDGLDAKGPEPGNASYYYSAPRLAVRGTVRTGNEPPHSVDGAAWMDREWSTSALSPDLAGWDWFALQLDDGRDLMYYRLRRNDGETSRFSGGSVAGEDGVRQLDADDVALEATRYWRSPGTRVDYPIGWRLRVPALELDVEVEPYLPNQEVDLSVRYWEGAVRVRGMAGVSPIRGNGYLELAGY